MRQHRASSLLALTAAFFLIASGCWGGSAGDDSDDSPHGESDPPVQQRVGESTAQTAEPTGASSQSAGIDRIGAKVEAPRLANHVFRRAHAVAEGGPVETDIKIVEVESPDRHDKPVVDSPQIDNIPQIDPEALERMKEMERTQGLRDLNKAIDNMPESQ